MELKRCNNCANGAWSCKESALPEVCLNCNFLSDGSPSEWKPKVATNADRIRAMSDEELAEFIANKIVNLENHKMIEQGYTPTATQLSALGHTCYCTLVQWLKQPAEGDA